MQAALCPPQRASLCSENDLIAAVRRGDDRAFEELYSRYRSRIQSYIFGMVGDHGRADDLAQEAFISALRRLRATDHPITFKPWMYEIAKNACIDEFRRRQRSREVPLAGDDEAPDSNMSLVSKAPSPDAAFENKARLDDLRGAFGGLSEHHHRILVLRELEGLSYGEIGERMGMSRPVVESTLFRARRRLSEEYQELVSGRRCEQVQMTIERAGARSARPIRVRERRQLARHLAHCQPCRRHARMLGFDESILKPTTIAQKIAALLPIPWLRFRRSGGSGDASGASLSPTLQPSTSQSLQTVARFADPAGPSIGLGRAAAAAAAVVIASAGGGVVSSLANHPAPSARSQQAAHHYGSTGSSARGAQGGGASSGSAGAANPAAGGAVGSSVGSSSRAGSASSATAGSSAGGARVGSVVTRQLPGAPAGGGQPSSGPTGSVKLPVQLPKLGLPSLPPVGLPSLPPVSLPKVGLPSLPPVSLPKLNLPQLPPIALPPQPKVKLPNLPNPLG
jgi:RNA polymerase sigma factor (sigma-70 family)